MPLSRVRTGFHAKWVLMRASQKVFSIQKLALRAWDVRGLGNSLVACGRDALRAGGRRAGEAEIAVGVRTSMAQTPGDRIATATVGRRKEKAH